MSENNDLGNPQIPTIDGELLPAQHPDAGGETPGQMPDEQTAELIGSVAVMVFGFVATRMGDHWRLTPDEGRELGSASAAVLTKYFPNAQASPEMRLLVVAGGIVGMRAIIHASIKKQEQLQADGTESNQSQSAE